ncbi:unnamed protein product [Kluyveromyces dobzhanskii CBS 2104]|uniref:WGS project CCBQ000000000 data, contig 00010 n=1 Tax=Kluyveromyces dobzhanskii CBS 2104 TaxID=1427455 RepID=A0A0A8LCU4_9SACH|nr:unnamed protein product [Kluyveromyces dobzhanskii CBS 2104]
MELSAKTHRGSGLVVNPKSLDELPIGVIFQILSQLEFCDLKNVSATCWTLRILTNEKLMYYGILNDSRNQYLWTKRYFLDSLRMLQSNRKGFDFTSLNDTTIFQSLRYLRNGVRKVSGNLMKLLESNDCLEINGIDSEDECEEKGIEHGGRVDDNENNSEIEWDKYNHNDRKERKYIDDGRNMEEIMPDNSDFWDSDDGLNTHVSNDGIGSDQNCASNISDFDQDSNISLYKNDEILPVIMPPLNLADNESTPSKPPSIRPTIIDKEGLKYLRVLEGFHRIGVIPIKQSPEKSITQQVTVTPDKYDALLDDVQFTPLSTINSLLKRIDSASDSHHDNSPNSFGVSDSRSESSVFSDSAPKLADNAWSRIYELEHQSESSSDSDSSSSTEFIRQLQSSKKVKDKAVLFERLLTKAKVRSSSLKEKKLASSSNPDNNRKVSDHYLEEMRRIASPTNSCCPSSTGEAAALDDVNNETVEQHGSHTRTKSSSSKQSKHSKPHHRKKLKALVMDGNRICYEKIPD